MSDTATREYTDAIVSLASTGHPIDAYRMLAFALKQKRIYKAQHRVNLRQSKLDAKIRETTRKFEDKYDLD